MIAPMHLPTPDASADAINRIADLATRHEMAAAAFREARAELGRAIANVDNGKPDAGRARVEAALAALEETAGPLAEAAELRDGAIAFARSLLGTPAEKPRRAARP